MPTHSIDRLQSARPLIDADPCPGASEVLTPAALGFLERLSTRFESTRQALLARRRDRHGGQASRAGYKPLPQSAALSQSGLWVIAWRSVPSARMT